MAILKDRDGNIFLEFLEVAEESMTDHLNDVPLTHSLVVGEHEGKYLLKFNRWRQCWELPGGIIDNGETPRECAIRELLEETNQSVKQLSFKGLMKFQLKPDDRLEYGALYIGEIDTINEFQANEEAEQIIFWDKQSDIGYITKIDKLLLDYD